MRIELGSEFDLSPNDFKIKTNNLWGYMKEYEVQWYDSGRSAIKAIAYSKEKTVLLPEYICESVIRCFSESRVLFYRITENFDIDEEDILAKLDENVGVVYVCHYFGFVQRETLMKKIRDRAVQVKAVFVEDTTQSFFSGQNLIGDLGVMSIRKWMPVSQGGVLYAKRPGMLDEERYQSLGKSFHNERTLGMMLKNIFLREVCDTNQIYRSIFERYEEELDKKTTIEKMSDLADLQMQCVDISEMIKKRKENARYLTKALERMNIKCIKRYDERECPFAFPMRVSNRDSFRNYLIKNQIYCAVHWPVDEFMTEEREQAKCNAEQLISLPIDQRYGEMELDYMIETIGKYGRDLSF